MKAIVPELIDTVRLSGQRLRAEHEPELAELDLDPRVYRTLWPLRYPPTVADVRDGLRRQLDHWERHGFGLWLLHDRTSGAMVGRGGLTYTDAAGALAVEVAWAIVADRWGQGLATELAQNAVRIAFQNLRVSELVAVTLPHNHASRRVMDKADFAYEREIVHAGLAHVLYRRVRGPAELGPR